MAFGFETDDEQGTEYEPDPADVLTGPAVPSEQFPAEPFTG